MENRLDRLILQSLVHDEPYFTAMLPHLKVEYFEDPGDKEIFKAIHKFSSKYHKRPSIETILIDAEKSPSMTDKTWLDVQASLDQMREEPDVEPIWRLKESQSWVKDRAFFIAFYKGVELLDQGGEANRPQIPILLSNALNITFDNTIGIEYGRNPIEQWEYYHSPDNTIECDIEAFNTVLKGGFRKKSLTVLMSSKTGGFKSGTMCHLSTAFQSMGKNVLYITLELEDRMINKRLDANLLNVDLDDLDKMGQKTYVRQVEAIKKNTTGTIITKEYPQNSAHAGHFRYLLQELESQQAFKPDVICVDYLNICASSRYAFGKFQKHQVVQGIAEELRQLAFEFDCAVITGTQSGRQGVKAKMDLDVDDVSESYGISNTVDVMFGIIDDQELSNQNILVLKQIKNRFGDINQIPFFNVGVEKSKMRLYNVENKQIENKQPHKSQNADSSDTGSEITWQKSTKLNTTKFII